MISQKKIGLLTFSIWPTNLKYANHIEQSKCFENEDASFDKNNSIQTYRTYF